MQIKFQHRTKDGLSLGCWSANQRSRQSHPNNRRGALSEEKVAQLTSLGFDWETGAARDERRWIEMFQRLKAFRKENLHTRVLGKYKYDPKLGRWADHQRRSYVNGDLSEQRQSKLDSIGFESRLTDAAAIMTKDDQWQIQYEKLKLFRDENGHCMVPYRFEDDPCLGGWVQRQRLIYSKNKMKRGRLDLLNTIGFTWDCTGEQ